MTRTWALPCGAVALVLLSGALSGCGSKKNAATPPTTSAGSSASAGTSTSTSAATSSVTSATSAMSQSSSATASPSSTAVVISSVVTCNWNWPNGTHPCVVKHHYPVPPLPVLTVISAGEHYEVKPSYDRISFTFTGTFPSYDVLCVSSLIADPSGRIVSLAGNDFLRIRFTQATAHDETGRSTVQSAPPRQVGFKAINEYAQTGDFEGVVSYGLSDYRTVTQSNPQVPVRVTEVTRSDGHGGLRYVVAFDVQNRGLGGNPA